MGSDRQREVSIKLDKNNYYTQTRIIILTWRSFVYALSVSTISFITCTQWGNDLCTAYYYYKYTYTVHTEINRLNIHVLRHTCTCTADLNYRSDCLYN